MAIKLWSHGWQDLTLRNFIIAYNKEDEDSCISNEGVEHSQ